CRGVVVLGHIALAIWHSAPSLILCHWHTQGRYSTKLDSFCCRTSCSGRNVLLPPFGIGDRTAMVGRNCHSFSDHLAQLDQNETETITFSKGFSAKPLQDWFWFYCLWLFMFEPFKLFFSHSLDT